VTKPPFATANQDVLAHDPSTAARKRRRLVVLVLGAITAVVTLIAWALWPQAHVAGPSQRLPPPPLPPLAERSWRDLRSVLPEEDEYPEALRPVKKSWDPYSLVPEAGEEYKGKVSSDDITYSPPECAQYPLDPRNVQTLVAAEKFDSESQGSKFVTVTSAMGIAVKLLKWSTADREVAHWDAADIKISLTQKTVVERQQDPGLSQAHGVGIKMFSPSVVWHVSGVPVPDQVYTVADEYTYVAFVRGVIVFADCKQFQGKQDYLPTMQKMFLETYQKVQALP
jgi:hypothetical protein